MPGTRLVSCGEASDQTGIQRTITEWKRPPGDKQRQKETNTSTLLAETALARVGHGSSPRGSRSKRGKSTHSPWPIVTASELCGFLFSSIASSPLCLSVSLPLHNSHDPVIPPQRPPVFDISNSLTFYLYDSTCIDQVSPSVSLCQPIVDCSIG